MRVSVAVGRLCKNREQLMYGNDLTLTVMVIP